MPKSDIGLIGLATMGANLARNIAAHKFKVTVFNRTTEKTVKFMEEFKNRYLEGSQSIEEFVQSLKSPRKIIIMVKAGVAVDGVIDQLLPYLEKNDIIIDCGNSNFKDTILRYQELKQHGIQFMGCGVSGGEEGALLGPSIMPGGNKKTWKELKPIFESIAAKNFSGDPCVTYVGDNGAGHYVKMVHNGIEYGVMQIMAEAYEILRSIYALKAPEIAKIFDKYNKGKLNSFLFEISVSVLTQKDEFNKKGYLIDYILDRAAQKGTGKWTAIDALEKNIPLPTITEAVFTRVISSEKGLRDTLSDIYKKLEVKPTMGLNECKKILEDALYAGMLSSYAQGYALIQRATIDHEWDIDLSEISRIWEGGCIIRAKILNFLHEAYVNEDYKNMHLFAIPKIVKAMKQSVPALRKIVAFASENGIPIPALATALMYFESITSKKVSANFIQGLRDYFGAHTYERTDKTGSFHTQWISKNSN